MWFLTSSGSQIQSTLQLDVLERSMIQFTVQHYGVVMVHQVQSLLLQIVVGQHVSFLVSVVCVASSILIDIGQNRAGDGGGFRLGDGSGVGSFVVKFLNLNEGLVLSCSHVVDIEIRKDCLVRMKRQITKRKSRYFCRWPSLSTCSMALSSPS